MTWNDVAGLSREEQENWRFWVTASEIALQVRRYINSGNSLHDIDLITVIQSVLRDGFPYPAGVDEIKEVLESIEKVGRLNCTNENT